MAAYYAYLWKATWIEALGISVLVLFILGRLVWKFYIESRQEMKRSNKILLGAKSFGWLVILVIYSIMFYQSEPDWFDRPVQIQGEIVGKNAIPGVSSTSYKIQVQGSEESEDLYLDHYSYQELEIGQFVNATYLPHRQEVITCKILPLSKEDPEEPGI
ncbi:MAG: hypothetical protein GX958_08375 [Desulfitobacterium sp.]|nr:hypothetical protein [Desulfitobacterium sp.]